MKRSLAAIAICSLAFPVAVLAASAGPDAVAATPPMATPQDRPYGGEIHLAVDTTDVERRIVHVHERLSGVTPNLVLLYPKWLPGNHAPTGPIERLAGLKITANGAQVLWRRDPVDIYAFRVQAPAGVKSIDIDFDYLSPTSAKVGPPEMSGNMLILIWNTVVLYPAGYYARQIPVEATLTLPEGWKFGSALEMDSTGGTRTTFKPVSLETLIDSPVYAGRYAARLDLDPTGKVPVSLDLFADHSASLVVKPEQLEAHRALVQQAYKLFASHHYAHYDFLYSLSEEVTQKGLEHQQSSENGASPDSFTDWDKLAFHRELLPHEFTHSWNGKFRRPADLWTPNYNVPMQNSLLWVYEGQTTYWGFVLAARSGLWTKQDALDQFAIDTAYYEALTGAQWRALQDTTNDPIINYRRPMSWRDFQRFEDYYHEGAMIWLDADTLIRERSQGKRSLDDFARTFFGINDGSVTVVTYTFNDLVKALNAVEPYDWARFFHQRLDAVAKPAPLDGVRRGGYRLIFTDTPSEFQKGRDDSLKHANLMFSIGLDIDNKDGTVTGTIWDSPAFKANITEGTQILAVNGAAYSGEVLKNAVTEARSTKAPIELILKNGDRFRVARIEYYDGLHYPHLERDVSVPARFDDIVAARK